MKEGTQQVLSALRLANGTARSGEALSDRLGVSRAQIWKHVNTLRKLGYEISGEPGDGYVLGTLPDRLYPEEIQARRRTTPSDRPWLANDVRYFEEADSTNRIALELGRDGAENGVAVIAEGQSAGRGRLGRSFFSPPHLNLYTSVILRPELELSEAPTLILAAGIAVAETVAEFIEDETRVTLKWPNDVLIDGLKTAGILLELSAEETRVGFVVMGIGVNLNVDRATFPDEFRHLATSLSSHEGHLIDRVGFAARLYDTLEEVLRVHASGGFEALRPRYERRFKMAGECVDVIQMSGNESTNGIVRRIASDGALEIERANGIIHRVIAGDVTLAKKTGQERAQETTKS